MASLVDRLPTVRGSYRESHDIAPLTWFRVGGPARVFYRPADPDDLADFIAQKPAEVPVYVLGVGSNTLLRDGGFPGVVIRLGGKEFGRVTIDGQRVVAGAAALDATVAKTAARAGLKGLGFYVGVPGTIGGALRMNAGAHGGDTRQHLVSAQALSPEGVIHDLSADELGLSYRHCALPADWTFLSATFECEPGDAAALQDELAHVQETREATQPIREKTGGSTFKNPPADAPHGASAWKHVDAAGCRGLRIGGAQVSEKHCNFLINTGEATATDIETLGETVRTRVYENSGVLLHWEIRRLGDFAAGQPVQTAEEVLGL
ncbi:MAG: UDP-N-acetylmuramate dehydrogenase [Alphaproteobacteria bacterium TMED89]|nr:UDP-N-acetylenolpyruvoylglucosamine reductase [Rhodospirillaceae bacterium]RPH10973.1 MAG: UDP-N-acetylmuramate dehydrogenase [Alphaproteobacteria bacterium TMED89]